MRPGTLTRSIAWIAGSVAGTPALRAIATAAAALAMLNVPGIASSNGPSSSPSAVRRNPMRLCGSGRAAANRSRAPLRLSAPVVSSVPSRKAYCATGTSAMAASCISSR